MATFIRSKVPIWHTPYSKLTTENENAANHEVETSYSHIALNTRAKSRRTRSPRRPRTKSRISENSRDVISEQTTFVSSNENKMSKTESKPIYAGDRDRDVSNCIGISIGVCAVIAGIGGVGAMIMLKALQSYRPDIDGYYMACYPFVFPAFTGVGMAYKRKMGSLTIHFGILLLGMVGGSIFYAFSVLPVYEHRLECVDAVMKGDCQKHVLIYLYIAFGAAGGFFSILGFLVSMCACKQASKNIADRKSNKELQEQSKQQADLEAAKQRKQQAFKSNYTPPAVNGSEKQNGTEKQNGGYDNLALTVDEKVMTKL
ncbi:hypothetical protein SNE40_018559 [Patella caerulea]|uniref:Uncharacterized protein n=1 Tax=Patella caerulea TaxID=87958 RepID=A0AAN8J5S1_PATCE